MHITLMHVVYKARMNAKKDMYIKLFSVERYFKKLCRTNCFLLQEEKVGIAKIFDLHFLMHLYVLAWPERDSTSLGNKFFGFSNSKSIAQNLYLAPD